MKTLHQLILGLALAAMAWGCQSENVGPQAGAKNALATYIPVTRPSVQCGPSVYTRMKAGNMDLGSVEVFNSASDLYVFMDLNLSKYLEEIKVFKGNATTIPLNDDGAIIYNQFPIQNGMSSPLNDYSFMLPLGGTTACTDLVIWARITTRGALGNVIATHYAWMMGTPVANGYALHYCLGPCPTGNDDAGNAN